MCDLDHQPEIGRDQPEGVGRVLGGLVVLGDLDFFFTAEQREAANLGQVAGQRVERDQRSAFRSLLSLSGCRLDEAHLRGFARWRRFRFLDRYRQLFLGDQVGLGLQDLFVRGMPGTAGLTPFGRGCRFATHELTGAAPPRPRSYYIAIAMRG